MNNKEYLNEERYQKNKKKITIVALIVLMAGLLLGGFLICKGLNQHSESNKQKLAEEKTKLVASKKTLEEKIKPVEEQIKALEREKFTGFNSEYYNRKDKIEELNESIKADKEDIKIIDDALDDSFAHCEFNGPKNNSYTAEYCSLKVQVTGNYNAMFYVLGGFVILVSLMISGSIIMFAKRREILAFQAQQVMPVAKEGIDEMSPAIGKAAGEIAKGIKQGLKDDEK